MKTITYPLLCAILTLTGCTVTVSPDGSKSATVDAPAVLKFLETYSTK
jgi:hypothetical protein